ncbi:MAG: hypothetical protein PHU06_00535 [Gallionella sp.]|nr:hypothetical protein [Gallionella sp.]MDD4957770.1 hypothetical protein [Gallionella sp.]
MKKTIWIAIGLFVVDALVLSMGAMAFIMALVILFWFLPEVVLLKYRKQSPKVPLTKIAIYSAMILAVMIANAANNMLAKHRAENLVIVIEKYHQSTGHYPENLEDLVPAYIPEVPTAKFAVFPTEFRYSNSKDTTLLFYVATPPFGRVTYNFNRQSWGYID